MENLIIEATPKGYATKQIWNTMTVGELIAYLERYDEDTRVYLSFDNGYSFGGLSFENFHEEDDSSEEE